MNRKEKKKLAFRILIILIVGVFFLQYNQIKFPFSTVPLYSDLGQCKGGWTTFSIDKVSIVGKGDRIRIYGIAKGSECMQIALSKEQLNNYLQGDYKATNTIYGNIKLLK